MRPEPEALMATVASATPVTLGCDVGVVCPALKKIVCGEIVSFESSALVSVTLVATAAALANVTLNVLVCPGPTTKLAGRLMPIEAETVIADVA